MLPFCKWKNSNFLLVFPIGRKVSLCNGVHDADVSMQSFGLKELGKQLSHLPGLFSGAGLVGRREYFVHRFRPPCNYKLVLVGKQELVTGGAAEDGCRLAKKRGFEDF